MSLCGAQRGWERSLKVTQLKPDPSKRMLSWFCFIPTLLVDAGVQRALVKSRMISTWMVGNSSPRQAGHGITRSYFGMTQGEPSFWHLSWRNELCQYWFWLRKQAHPIWWQWSLDNESCKEPSLKCDAKADVSKEPVAPCVSEGTSHWCRSKSGLWGTFQKVSAPVREGRLLNQEISYPMRVWDL